MLLLLLPVRDGLQDVHVKIRVGAHQLWAPGEAISVINRLEKYGIELVDQPVIRYNLDALKMVRESVSVPVAGHECAQLMYDVLNVVKKDAADYLYLDGRFHTGYNDVRISAGTAEAAGIQCIYHAASGVGDCICNGSSNDCSNSKLHACKRSVYI